MYWVCMGKICLLPCTYLDMHVFLAAIQLDVNGSMTVYIGPISVGNSTKRYAASFQ